MFEQVFDSIDPILWKDSGCTGELDYAEQTSWMLFLKYLDDLESERAVSAELEGKSYTRIIDASHCWSTWAAPKNEAGQFDHDNALTGDDLLEFVNQDLVPYLASFRERADSSRSIEYKIGEVFREIKNKLQDGYILRDALERVDELSFNTQKEKHELSHLYETKIRKMGNAGRNGGEYYTPRPLIRAMIGVIDPQIGETIYDGSVGSAGFLCETYEYLRSKDGLTTKDLKTLQDDTFFAKEKKSLAYVIAIMNMVLHGIEAPNIVRANTLEEKLSDIQESDRHDIILANPPFGGKERKQIQNNFPIASGETAYLFLQHFIKKLRAGGRSAVVIKNTFLSNSDNASIALRRQLLTECNVHTILDLPSGTFTGAGVKTVVLFFEKGSETEKIWYYQLSPGRNLGKTKPLNDGDMAEFLASQKTKAESEKSWSVDLADIDQETWELTVNNPNLVEEADSRTPQEIVAEIEVLDKQAAEALQAIKELL